MSRNLKSLLQQLRDEAKATPELAALDLPRLARPAVGLVPQKISSSELGLGESRLGGTPDLPPNLEWPRWSPSIPRKDKFARPWQPNGPAPLGLIAQIDLSSLPRIDDSLPHTGWLYFFYDRYCEPWGFDPADRECCRVLYANCDRSVLMRAQPPADADADHVAPACRLEARAQWTIPDEPPGVEYDSPVYDAYRELCEKRIHAGGPTNHHLLGYPQVLQNPMELECQLASNGVFCGTPAGFQSEQGQALAGGADDWQLLLQVDSDDEGPGWMWGDLGRLYYWVKRQDLASLRFQDAWLVLQCH